MPPFWGEHPAEERRIAGGKTSSQVIAPFQDRTMVVLEERAVTVEDTRLGDGLNRRVREKKAFGTVPRIWALTPGWTVAALSGVRKTGQEQVCPMGKGCRWWWWALSGTRKDLVLHGCPPNNHSQRNKRPWVFTELFKRWWFNRNNQTYKIKQNGSCIGCRVYERSNACSTPFKRN